MATITNSICTNGQEIDIQSSAGNINIGTASVANNIVMGNQTGGGATTIYSGSGGMILNPTSSFTVSAGSDIFIDGGSDMHIGTTVSNHTIAFGTASGKHINIGSNSATIQIFTGGNGLFVQTSNGGAQFDASAGGNFLTTGAGIVSISDDAVANTITIGTGAAVKAVTIGSTNTTSSVSINAGASGAINVGTNTAASTITIGNQTSGNGLTLFSGSVGMLLQPTSSFTVSAGSDVFIDANSDMHIGTLVSSHAIAFGTASGKVITIGSTTATVGLTTGNGGFNVSTNNGGASFSSTSSGGFFITGAGITSISDDATANTITIGTGAAVKSITIGSTNTTSSVTINTGSGGITIPSFTTTGALVSNASGLITDATASTAGFVLTSNGAGSAPTFQAAGGGGGGGLTWNNTTGSTQAMAVGNGYVNNGSGAPTIFTLPSTASVGQIVAVQGANSGLWQIDQNASQTIAFNGATTTAGVGGVVAATGQYDTLFLICITANTGWAYNAGFGNYLIV